MKATERPSSADLTSEPKTRWSGTGSSLPRNGLIRGPKFSLFFRSPPRQPSHGKVYLAIAEWLFGYCWPFLARQI